MVSYAEKTEECPYCHRFVLRTIYNHHTEHNCVGITGKNIVSNGLHQLRTAFPSRNRSKKIDAKRQDSRTIFEVLVRAIDPTRKSIFDPGYFSSIERTIVSFSLLAFHASFSTVSKWVA